MYHLKNSRIFVSNFSVYTSHWSFHLFTTDQSNFPTDIEVVLVSFVYFVFYCVYF